ncbi:MAG: hypothetical protein CMJ49_02105 [Planctomycetaceae bacterium]|nr:hypothetical protein [Planctomycetaceae bacterium]
MKVLVIGGAGHVGTVVRPALEAEHDCWYLDLDPVPDRADRTTVASVYDRDAMDGAVDQMDAVIYLAMGINRGEGRGINDIEQAFGVNCGGVYQALHSAGQAGVKRFVFASTASVYATSVPGPDVTEDEEPDGFHGTYGVSKRAGEFVCKLAAAVYPDMTITALRLFHPRSEEQFRLTQVPPGSENANSPYSTGPEDTRRLFLAALALDQPGLHLVNTSGDMRGEGFNMTRARELLGWAPRGQ